MKTERSPAGHGDAAADIAVRDCPGTGQKQTGLVQSGNTHPAPGPFVPATADGQAAGGPDPQASLLVNSQRTRYLTQGI